MMAKEDPEKRACPFGRGGGREWVSRGGSVLVEGVGASVFGLGAGRV